LKLSREEFRYSRISFSQFGEDLAVLRWLDEWFPNAKRVYLDAGAFHPIHCSNTLLLHKRGWWGVNVDMVAAKIDCFRDLRPDDFNVIAALDHCDRDAYVMEHEVGLIDELAEASSVKDCRGSAL